MLVYFDRNGGKHNLLDKDADFFKSYKLIPFKSALALLNKIYTTEANRFLRLLDKLERATDDTRTSNKEFSDLLSIRDGSPDTLHDFLLGLSPPVFLRVISYLSKNDLQKLKLNGDLDLFGKECEAAFRSAEVKSHLLSKALLLSTKFTKDWVEHQTLAAKEKELEKGPFSEEVSYSYVLVKTSPHNPRNPKRARQETLSDVSDSDVLVKTSSPNPRNPKRARQETLSDSLSNPETQYHQREMMGTSSKGLQHGASTQLSRSLSCPQSQQNYNCEAASASLSGQLLGVSQNPSTRVSTFQSFDQMNGGRLSLPSITKIINDPEHHLLPSPQTSQANTKKTESDGLGTIDCLTGKDVVDIMTTQLAPLQNLTMVLSEYSYIDIPSSPGGTPKIRVQFNVDLAQDLVKHALNKKKGNPAIKFNIPNSARQRLEQLNADLAQELVKHALNK